jgi:hypothetical protein
MKKLLVALSFMAVLVFAGTPSMALVGMPDAVPGTDVIQPFFLVAVDGGLDTLSVITEVKGEAGYVHWTLYDQKSVPIINDNIPYTPYDVIPISIRGVLQAYASVAELEALTVNLGTALEPDLYYMGYIEFWNSNRWIPQVDPGATDPYDNLIGHMYLVDLLNGIASGVVIPARELAQRKQIDNHNLLNIFWPGWWFTQNSALVLRDLGAPWGLVPWPEFTDYEVFTATAYAHSKGRESDFFLNQIFNLVGNIGNLTLADIENLQLVPGYFRLLPRYFIRDAYGDTWFFLWTNGNWGRYYDQDNDDWWPLHCNVWDEAENPSSHTFNIPYELNALNIRDALPASVTSIGGWVDFRWDYEWVQFA